MVVAHSLISVTKLLNLKQLLCNNGAILCAVCNWNENTAKKNYSGILKLCTTTELDTVLIKIQQQLVPVFIKLDGESRHRLECSIGKSQFHEHLAVLARKSTRDLQALSFCSWQPDLSSQWHTLQTWWPLFFAPKNSRTFRGLWRTTAIFSKSNLLNTA